MGQDTEKSGSANSAPASVARMVEDIVGCKWSLAVLGAIRRSIIRPGAIERSIAGISTKVLNERLAKMLRYGILVKQSYPEVPPRVEYGLTPFGEQFVALLDEIEALQAQVDTGRTGTPEPKR